MKRFAIVTRPDKISQKISKQIERKCLAKKYIEDKKHPEIIFVVGGDGTFIYAVHQYIQQLNHVCFYGIHTGTLGFYTDFQATEVNKYIECFFSGKTKEFQFPLLKISCGKNVYYAMNEMRIENAARTQTMDVYFNGKLFEDYRGTGMLVATQLGSSAYNRSLKGAVIQEGVDALEIVEISGIHHRAYRSFGSPLVIKPDTKITFQASSFEGALLGIDSDVYALKKAKKIQVEKSTTYCVRYLRGRNVTYFDRLKSLF